MDSTSARGAAAVRRRFNASIGRATVIKTNKSSFASSQNVDSLDNGISRLSLQRPLI
jgi:hypothetical protein